MSSTIDIPTVAHSISTISITGITILDIHEIVSAVGLETYILAPRPKDFVTDFSMTAMDVTKGIFNVYYTMHYTYYHCAIGQDLYSSYGALWTNIALCLAALAKNTSISGCIDHDPAVLNYVGGLMDNAENKFHGAEISKRFMQFLEV